MHSWSFILIAVSFTASYVTINTWVRRLMDTVPRTTSGLTPTAFSWQVCWHMMKHKRKEDLICTAWHQRVKRPINGLITNWKFSTPQILSSQLLHSVCFLKVKFNPIVESVPFPVLHVKCSEDQKQKNLVWLIICYEPFQV